MNSYIDDFLNYLQDEKKTLPNTIEAYKRDVVDFVHMAENKNISDIRDISNTEVVSYLIKLKTEGKSPATVNRRIASLRSFFAFLKEKDIIGTMPTDNIKSPKIERKELEYLTIAEMDKLLSLPDNTRLGIRDKAILELLYATGIRVSEVIETNFSDINLRMGFITCQGNKQGKARLIPIGRPARAAMEDYVYEVRPKLLKEKQEEKALFVNYEGERLSRQGLWKIIKQYAKQVGVASKITPQVLRNSFAVHMVQNGADLKTLQELLGHEDISATQIYLSVTKNRVKDVYDKTHPRA